MEMKLSFRWVKGLLASWVTLMMESAHLKGEIRAPHSPLRSHFCVSQNLHDAQRCGLFSNADREIPEDRAGQGQSR